MATDLIEIQDLIISILVLGFAFSFRHWGEPFSWSTGMSNMILITFLVAFSFFVHEIIHRIVAQESQAELKYRAYKFGLLLAVVLAFLTNGWFVFAAVGVITITPFVIHRPGKGGKDFLGPHERAKIAVSGPMANFALAVIAAILFNATNSFVWEKLFVINAWLGVMNLFPFFRNIPHVIWHKFWPLPPQRKPPAFHAWQKGDETLLPQTEGETVFFGSRPTWIFAFMFVTIFCVLFSLTKEIGYSLGIAFIVGFVLYMVWQYYVEPWSHTVKGKKKPFHYKE